MRGVNQHLSGEEIEQLTGSATDVEVGALEGAMDHLERCDLCRFRMLSVRDLSGEMLQGAGGARAGNSPCPPEARWLEVAAGLGTSAERKRYINHAAGCAQCGRSLKEAVEDVGMALTEEEETKVAVLDSAKPEWQSNLAKKIADSAPPIAVPEKPDSSSGKFVFWPRWVSAFAAFIVAAGGGWWAWILLRAPSVEGLLAQAYTEQRTLEVRIANADFGPLRVQRGGESSRMSRPSALLDAEALISHKLAAQPDNPSFLQMSGRANLMDWKYDAAIQTLQHARDLDPNSTSIRIDLASAYFERAEDKNRPIDYGQALELLGQVLAKTPDDPVALFNHAVVSDRMFMYSQSIEDERNYLRVASQDSWMNDVRLRLEDTQKQSDEYAKRASVPLFLPQVIKERVSPTDESTWKAIDDRIEDYLDAAVTVWLPKAFTFAEHTGASSSAIDARGALARLSNILEKLHQDSWLADMIAARPNPAWRAALTSLAAAVQHNESGRSDEALSEARRAASGFKQAGSKPGYLRAELELAYALHRSSQGKDCLQIVDSLLPDMTSHHYRWMEAQALLEKSVCSNMANDLEGLENSLSKAISSSQEHEYRALYLRALGFSATEKWSVKGDYAGSWAQNRIGLSYFWKGTFPWLRAYNFYQDLAASSEISGFEQVAFSLRKETVSIDAKMDDDTRHAVAHFMLAKAAAAAGRVKEAQEEFSLAETAFGRLPQTTANQGYRIYSNIQLAQLKGDQGLLDQALELLNRVKPDLSLGNTPSVADFYKVLGELNRRKDNVAAAEAAFHSAISLVQAGYASVPSEADRHAMLKTVSESYRGLVQLTLAAHNPQEALNIWEQYRGWSSSTVSPQASPLAKGTPLPAIENNPDVTTIIYADLNDSIAIWALGGKDFTWASVKVDPQELERLTRRFSEQCSEPNSDIDGLRRNAARLYQLLIHPIESHLRAGNSLVIESDSVLNRVPMEALVSESGHYLVDGFPITYSPGLQRYQSLRRDEGIARNATALIVNPRILNGASKDLLPAADADREAQVVSDSFSNAKLLSGPEATWAAVKKDLPTATVFHFAGHGVAAENQNTIMLASSSGGAVDPVGPSRLSTLDMRSLQLAVLSACSTGKSDDDGIADANSLVGVFLQANVPHVIAARWNVDSVTTSKFIEELYRRLLDKENPGNAVRLAASAVRQDSATAHPYFWAGFAAFGHK